MSNLHLFPVPRAHAAQILRPALQAVLDRLHSVESKKSYRNTAALFLTWLGERFPGELLNRTNLLEWKNHLLEKQRLCPTSVNRYVSVIRAIAAEASESGLMSREDGAAVLKVRHLPHRGIRQGRWLTAEQARLLVATALDGTIGGLRDTAILAVLLGCGLRRGELARLRVSQVQEIWGRWAIVDLVGKGMKTRSVAMPLWTRQAITAWTAAAGIVDGYLFRAVSRLDRVRKDGLAPDSVAGIVERVSTAAGVRCATHDLRRTYAKLARKGHAELEQIQLSLGHSAITTTMQYIGDQVNFEDAPCDHLGIQMDLDFSTAGKKPAGRERA